MAQTSAVFTDLDGSLHCRDRGIHPADRAMLEELGAQGIGRVVATGRSLFVARQVLTQDFPIDFVIFSSGAGILDWRRQELIYQASLTPAEALSAWSCLRRLQLDNMLHFPVPNNHGFWYDRQRGLPDFEARLRRYAVHAQPVPTPFQPPVLSQLLAITSAPETAGCFAALQKTLPRLTLLRTTSPLDAASGWLEILPAHVSKSQGAAWLCRRQGWTRTLAFGNDFNDWDLLDWAQRAYVTRNAPAELRQRFTVVGEPAEAGFSQAVRSWR